MNKTLLSTLVVIAAVGVLVIVTKNFIASNDAQTPREALITYFDLLNTQHYQEALAYHGSGFEILRDMNPSVFSSDHKTLIKNGCEMNGWHCLPIKDVLTTQKISPDEFMFTVEFLDVDGNPFQRGPCCGATEGPIETSFDYTVKKVNGQWLVMTSPVYTP